jgi:hypothetical protein
MQPTGFEEVEFRQHAELVGEHRARNDGVEERRVHRIHGVFQDLQPVARIEILSPRHQPHAGSRQQTIVGGERRHLLRRPHVGEHDAVRLVRRVRAVAQPVLQRAVGRLAGRLQDGAVHVEQPAVIAAANTAFADQPEFERGAAMRAVQLQQADGAALVAEHHQLLAQDPKFDRQIRDVVGVADRLPEAAEILAARRVRSDVGEFRVLARHFAVIVAAEFGP